MMQVLFTYNDVFIIYFSSTYLILFIKTIDKSCNFYFKA